MGKPFGIPYCLLCFCVSACAPQQRTCLPEDVNWGNQVVGPTNIAMKQQSSNAARVLEDRLHQLLTDFKEDLDKEAQDLLDESQTAWQEFARKQASFLADRYRGGTHRGLEYTSVYMDLLLRRIREIKDMKESYSLP